MMNNNTISNNRYAQTIDLLTSGQFEGLDLNSSIHENYQGSSDIDNFDLYDITSGNIISCDQPIHYEPSIRWDDNDGNSDNDVTANVIINDNNYVQQQQQNHHHQSPQPHAHQFAQTLPNNIISPRLITINNIDHIPTSTITVPPTSPTPLQNKLSATSPLSQAITISTISNPMLASTRTPVLVECKDMDPSSKVKQLQPYVIETFPIQCSKFYRVIIDSNFWRKVSEEMGFYDMNEGSWVTSASGCHQERTLTFKTPISFKIGPKVASVTQIQRIRRTSTGGYFMETSSISKDVPYGDSFSVENYISLEPTVNDQCQLKVSTAVKFTKSIWGIGGLIEKSVIQSNKDFFVIWTKMARITIEQSTSSQPPAKPIELNSVNFLSPQPSPSNSVPPVNSPNKQQSPPQQSIPVQPVNHNVPNKQLPPTPVTNKPQQQALPPQPIQMQPPHLQQQVLPQQQQQQLQQDIGSNFEEIKRLFFQLFRETQNPRTVKIISQKTNQHVANITIHVHYTVGHVVQYLIPQALPELVNNQNFDFFWFDKRNDASLFFPKDMDLPILNYLQSSDSLCISTLTAQQALKKQLSFEIIQSGKRAIIKSNQQNGLIL